MPIRTLLADTSFSPEDIAALTAAFEESLQALRLTNREDPLVLKVARRIIELASRGERDPARLQAAVMKTFRDGPGHGSTKGDRIG